MDYLDLLHKKPKNKTLKSLQSWQYFPWVVWALGALFYCYEYLLRTIPGVIKPDLMQAYHLDDAQFGNLAGFYLYIYVPMQICVGLLMDRYRPRLLLSFAVVGCVIGSILFAGTNLLWVAQVGRFCIGLGSAFAFVGVLKLASVWLPPNRFALIAGLTAALGPIGALVGNNFLDFLVVQMGWRETIFFSAAFGVVLAFGIWFIVREGKGRGRTTLRYHTQKLSSVLADVGKAAKNPQIWLNGLFSLFLYMTLELFADLWGTPFVHEGLGIDQSTAVHLVSLVYFGWIVGSPFFGWFSDYLQRRKFPMIFGAFAAAACMSILLYIPNLPITIIGITLFGAGFFSATQSLTFAVAKENAPSRITGSAVAITNLFSMFGGMILQPVVGAILDNGNALQDKLGSAALLASYQHALVVLPIGMLFSAIALFMLRETRCQQQVFDEGEKGV